MRFISLFTLVFFIAHAHGQQINNTGIEVIGKASVSAVPDQFLLSLRVKERGENAQTLKAQVDKHTQTLINKAKKLGINDKHIQSAKLNIHLYYDRPDHSRLQNSATAAHKVEVSRQITINLTSLDNYDSLVDAVISLKGIEISPLQMAFKEPNILYEQALDLAIANAKSKAERIAKQAGVTLGPLRQLREASYGIPEQFVMAAESSPMRFKSSAGNSSVSAQVTVTFDLLL